jgi:hypothetical protein
MKLYYFMLIAIGIMYTFGVAGINTESHNILTMLGTGEHGNETAIVNPDVDDSITDPRKIPEQTNFWSLIKLGLVVGLGLITFGILAGGNRSEGVVYALAAGFAVAIFVMFVFDFYSILTYMGELTSWSGWIFHLTWILIMFELVGFALSLVQFVVGGGD